MSVKEFSNKNFSNKSEFFTRLFIFSVLDDHANVQFFDDSLLTPVRPLGQGHFGLVELCCYERDPIRRKGHGELVAVKRLKSSFEIIFSYYFYVVYEII